MKTLRLRKEQYELFSRLDPLEISDYLEFPGWFAVGVFMDSDEMEEQIDRDRAGDDDFFLDDAEPLVGDIPAGFMILSDWPDRLSLEWICVEPVFTSRNVGEWLLKVARMLAQQCGKEKLAAYYRKEVPYYNSVLSYMKDRGFSKTEVLGGEWGSPIGTLLNHIKKTETFVPKVPVTPLMDFSSVKLAGLFKELDEKENAAKLYPIEGWQNLADGKCSLFCMDGEEVAGAIIMQKINDTLYPVYLWAEAEEIMTGLFVHVMEEAHRKYGEKASVLLISRDASGTCLHELFQTGAMIENKYLLMPASEREEAVS